MKLFYPTGPLPLIRAACPHFLVSLAVYAVTIWSAPGASAQATERLYLSGHGPDDAVAWEFSVSEGRKAGTWSTLPVPSQWEMHGFGAYNYGHDWTNERRPLANEVGHYRTTFRAPEAWEGRTVEIVFGGVMTDATVRINGRPAGPTHHGGFYQFEYDISDLLDYGAENTLEVEVAKVSANASVNAAEREGDYWIFGGIFRPVWLEAYPAENIEHLAVDARHTGELQIDVDVRGLTHEATLVATVSSTDGTPVGPSIRRTVAPGDSLAVLSGSFEGVRPWSPEWPALYHLEVVLERDDTPLHRSSERIGFRTVDVRVGDGIYVNDRRVHLKGVNRHSFWPESGRTTSRRHSIEDVLLIKGMNMNAVRTAHYPPDKHFLEVADSLGLFVINELAGWQDAYDTDIGRQLVREMVRRDVNHPSVVFWSNGNEGGFNRELIPDYGTYDPQDRPVLLPWENFSGIHTSHYRNWECCAGQIYEGTDVIMPTEFLHGLYDGGHGAGLKDWWNSMLRNPLSGGGFLWAFADEGILRTDLGDTLDTDANHGADGIVGPHREKEGSYFAIKEIWSPIYFPLTERATLPKQFDGRLRVENRYYFTNLDEADFTWELVRFDRPQEAAGHRVSASGSARASAEPWLTTNLDLELPSNWQDEDALFLTATDPHGREIYTWTWMIDEPAEVRQDIVHPQGAPAEADESDDRIILRAGGTAVEINRATGMLHGVERDGQTVSLSNGPRLVSGPAHEVTAVRLRQEGSRQIVEAEYDDVIRYVRWTMHPGGWLELEYQYGFSGLYDFIGVTFDYPEQHVTGMTWLGRGPYRVWKNRQSGQEFGLWEKAYNDAVTGLMWEYPEFKGYHANLYWATLHTTETPITVLTDTPNLFLRVFTPRQPGESGTPSDPVHTHVAFPEGDLSFLRAIPPIGTKFWAAEHHGPAGGLNRAQTHWHDEELFDYRTRLFFYFGQPPRAASSAQ